MNRRWLILLLVYLVIFGGGWYAGHLLMDVVAVHMTPQNEARMDTMLAIAGGAFVATSAIPFVPGAEIGIGMIMVFGAKVALLVYFGMVVALMASYCVGRFVPASSVAAALGYFGLRKARDLVQKLAPLDAEERLALLSATAPRRVIPILLRYRYLTLIVLFNMPGNSVIGGGGGIAFTAGLSGLYSLPAYFATVLFAVAPLPLLVLLSERLT